MAQMVVRNKAQVLGQLDQAIARLSNVRIGIYREAVWKLFCHIVRNTPQYSGAAVAHWTIGIGASAAFYDPTLGRPDTTRKDIRKGALTPFHKGGDAYWARLARQRERPKLAQIRLNTVVVIANGVLGDTDNGHSTQRYLEDLQNVGYWRDKLRLANQPYVTAAESGIAIAMQYHNKKINPYKWVPSPEEDA